MRRRKRSRSILLLTTITTVLALLCGCTTESGGPAVADGGDDLLQPAQPRLNAPTRDGQGPSNVEVLAEQTAQDAEFLLQMRRDAAETDDRSAPPNADRPPATKIVWNDAPGRRNMKAQAIGNPEDSEPFKPSPLFRDPDDPIEVEDLPEAESDADGEPTLTADQLNLLLVELRREIFPRSTYSDQPLRELLFLASMSIIDPESALNPEAFRDLSEEERELLATFQQFFADLGRKLDGSVEAEEAIVNAVLELRRSLVKDPELTLPTVEMCWRVGGFGDFDAFARHAFLAHAEQQFILYLEFEGFASELNKKDQWVTEISQQLEIISDRDGIPVWTESWRKAVDVTSKQRRDFFTTQIVTLPKALSVGKYQLKVRTRDEKSGAEAEASIEFEMVADEKLAAKVPG